MAKLSVLPAPTDLEYRALLQRRILSALYRLRQTVDEKITHIERREGWPHRSDFINYDPKEIA
jgi:hypothetical protein